MLIKIDKDVLGLEGKDGCFWVVDTPLASRKGSGQALSRGGITAEESGI